MTPWTVARQAPLSMEFSRQEYWSELPIPTQRYLPDSRIESESLASPALAGGFFTTETHGKPLKRQVHACLLNCLAMSDSLQPHGL